MLICFASTWMLAQRSITGTVTDTEGEPLIGASILVQGTTSGTVTDIDGNFSIDVPTAANVLVVSYTGFTTLQYTIDDVASVVNIELSESASQLNEVVVTALGIRKEKKALGYSVATIGSGQVENRVESDVGRILRGKAAGVDITQTSGVAGSGTNIIIRGYSSITGSNQPLFVVDGVPFNSSTNTDRGFATGGATASSRFLDLDPNNIAEINVLKGLSATVLYGEQGANGVILVTTKNGRGGQDAADGFEVSVTQSVARTEVANLPDYQDTYGNGFSGNFGWFFSNWGPSFDTRGSNGIDENGQVNHPLDQGRYNAGLPQFEGARYDYRPYDNVTEFFQAGTVYNTSVSVDRNFGNGVSFNANYSYLDDTGFVPQNTFDKHNAGIGGSVDLNNGLKITASLNVVSSDRVAPPASVGFGSNPSGASVFANVLYTPRSIDLMGLPYENPIDGSQVYYRQGSSLIQNPRWGVNNMFDRESVQRYFGNINLSYELTDWLTASYRFGADTYAQEQRREINRGGSQVPDGQLIVSNRTNTIVDQVLNLSFDANLSEAINLSGVVGYNERRDNFDRTTVESSQQFIFDLFRQDNFIEHIGTGFKQQEAYRGIFASVTAGLNSYLYVTASGRQDYSSTLEADNRGIFYPSLSASFVPTDAFESLQGSNILNYLKIRAGYGSSARFPDPYTTRSILIAETNQGLTPNGESVLNTNSVDNRLGNLDLQPELLGEFEIGIEGRFFGNRVGLDLSLYDKQSTDLLVDLPLDPASGYTVTQINAAEVSNRGIEANLNLVPLKGTVTWDNNINFTRNVNIVESVAEGVENVLIAGYTSLGNFAIEGESFGAIQGTAFQRGPNGGIIVNPASGEYERTAGLEIIGDPVPNYQMNWLSTVSYKGLSLNWQFSYTDGGDIYSVTTATMLARGLTTDTDFDRSQPLILPGENVEGEPNNIQGYAGDYGFAAYFGADEGSIFDGTVIRLREVALTYSLPVTLLDRTPFGSVSFRLAGENLWFNAPNFPEGVNFDPEVLSLGVGNGRGFDFLTGPTAKKYGATVTLTF